MAKLIYLILMLFPGLTFAAPTILYSGTDVLELRRGSIQFTIVASDGPTVDTLAGAVLVDPLTGATYGGFSTGAQKGTYQLVLERERLERTRPLEPTTNGLENRTFRAVVYGTTGSTFVDFTVILHDSNIYQKINGSFFDDLTAEIKSVMQTPAYIGQKEFFIPYTSGYNSVTYNYKSKETETYFGGQKGATRPGRQLYVDMKSIFTKYSLQFTEEGNEYVQFYFGIRCIDRAGVLSCWQVHQKP